jgi:hypothetical protein
MDRGRFNPSRDIFGAGRPFSKDAIQRTFTRQCVLMSNCSSRTLGPHGAVIGELSRRQMSSAGAGTSWAMSGQTWESCGEEPDRMVAINVRAADRDGARGVIDGAPRTSPVMAAFVILCRCFRQGGQ